MIRPRRQKKPDQRLDLELSHTGEKARESRAKIVNLIAALGAGQPTYGQLITDTLRPSFAGHPELAQEASDLIDAAVVFAFVIASASPRREGEDLGDVLIRLERFVDQFVGVAPEA